MPKRAERVDRTGSIPRDRHPTSGRGLGEDRPRRDSSRFVPSPDSGNSNSGKSDSGKSDSGKSGNSRRRSVTEAPRATNGSRRERDQPQRPRRDRQDLRDSFRDREPIPKKKRSLLRRLFRWFWALFILGVLAGGVAFFALSAYVSSVPLPPEAVQVQTAYVFDVNGKPLATLTNGENRESVKIAEVPRVVIDAVLAAEDRRFYEHGGVDPLGIVRAVYQDVRSNGRPQGGSTITQQYVKNVYVGRERSLKRKLREAAISVKLERKLSKDQILERYLNTIYFGRGAYGIQAAAKAYFNHDLSETDLPQAAYLAALIRGPESTDATRNLPKATQRRQSVLDAMLITGVITQAQHDDATARPIVGDGEVVARRPSSGTTYNDPDSGSQFAVDYARRYVIDTFGAQALETGGLRITTSIDLTVQKRVKREAEKLLNKDSDPDTAVVVENHEGQILAMLGGKSWTESNVNLAVGRGFGGEGRAGGSTFKPFALAATIRQGFTVESAFKAPNSIEIVQDDGKAEPWKVTNYDDKSYATMNLIDATRLSINTVFAQLVTNENVGAAAVADTATLLGIKSPLQAVDSIVLGTQNVAPLEMADAYRTFANRGVASDPVIVVKVTDANGKELSLPAKPQHRVLSEENADVMNSVLSTVVNDGTGVAAKLKGAPVAGKTGTTNDYNDAWFVGYTPKKCCVVAIWMGYAGGGKRMTNVHGRKVSGGSFPAELFARIMTPLVEGVDVGTFAEVKEYPGDLLGPSRRGGSGDVSGDTPAVTKPRRKKPKAPTVQDTTADTEAQRVPAAGAIDAPADTRNPVEVVPQPAPQPDPQPAPAPQPDPVPAPPPVEVVIPPPA
jgi:penicillin-binding protein 1A